MGQTWDTKRGSAGAPRGENGVSLPIAQVGALAGANALNSRWIYTWGNTPPADVTNGTFNGEYVPMIWSANTSSYQTTVNRILGYAGSLNTKYVLGFNEPERADQSNMTVANAITIWDGMDHQFAAAGIKLVSPAVGDDTGGRAWIADFMAEATTRNLTVDAIAFHWYGNLNLSNPTATANSFLSRVDYYWNTYQRPIWITEFAGMDWNDVIPTQQLIDFNAAFLKAAVAGLESRSYVQRYSWWQFGMTNSGGANDTNLLDVSSNVYTPTVIGDSYAPSYGTGATLDLKNKTLGKTNLYLRGGSVINSVGAPFVTAYSLDAIDGTSTFGGDANWDVQNGFLRVRAGASLSKISPGQVTLANLTLTNAGQLSVTAGVLELGQNINFASSAGTFRVSGGTLLVTGSTTSMANPVVIQSGGTVIMDSADASSMTSTFDVQAGGTLQIGRTTSSTNVFPDVPTALTNNGTVVVYHDESIRNMTGAGTLVAENRETQIRSNPGFTGAISVTNGQLNPRDATAFGTTAGITTVQGNLATGYINLTGGISTGAEPIALVGRQGVALNSPHVVNSSGTNTLAGNLTLAIGGFDYNLQSDSGLLVVSGSIVSSPNGNNRNLKLLGAAAGSFTGAITLDPAANNTVVKNGTGTWTLTGAATGVDTFQALQGRLVIAGPVAGGFATVSSGAEIAFVGSGSANNITRFSGAGSVSFSGNSTNVLSGTVSTSGAVTVAGAQLTLTNLRVAHTGDISVASGLLELGNSLTFASSAGTFRTTGGTLLVTGSAASMGNPFVIQAGGTLIFDSSNGSTTTSTFDVQSGGMLQIGRTTSNTNIFPDAPVGLTNNGTVIVYDTESVANMTGAGLLVAENEETQTFGNPTFAGAISVTNGQLIPRDASALGTAAGITTVQGNLATGNITLRDSVSTGAEPITLGGRQGAAVNSPHILNSAATNTVAGNITLATGGSDYNLRSDSGLLVVSGSVVSAPSTGTVNLKLLGTASGSFTGGIAFNAGAANTLVKNGIGTWTLTGSVGDADAFQVLQGRLALGGPVSGGTAAISSGAHLAIVGSGSANNITNYSGAGTLSFGGNATNVLTGTINTTGLLAVDSGHVTLASNSGASYKTVATLASLSIAAPGQLVVPAHGGTNASVIVTSQLSTLAGVLDLTNNDLIVRNGDASTIRSLVTTGRLISSVATPGAAPYTTLAIFENSDGGGVPYFDAYDGITGLTAGDVIVKYTYVGDSNLDGILDAKDLANVIEGYSAGLSGWAAGDINNSGGPVNAADIALFLAAYDSFVSNGSPSLGNGQGGAGGGGAIPEPSLVLPIFAAWGLTTQRRRRAAGHQH